MPGTSLAGHWLGLWALTAEGSRFSPWSGSLDPTSHMVQPKNKRRKFYTDSFNTRIVDWSHETIPLRMSFPDPVALVGDTGRLRCGEGGASPGSSGRSRWHWTGPEASLLCFHPGNLHMCGMWHRYKAAPRTTQRPGYRSTGRLERDQKHEATVRQRVCSQSIPSMPPVRSNPLKTACVLWHSGVKSSIDTRLVTANPTNRKLSNTFLNYSGSTSVDWTTHFQTSEWKRKSPGK